MLVARLLSILLEHVLDLVPLCVQYYTNLCEKALQILMLGVGFLEGRTLR